jgi:hypothetical protein
MPMTWFRCMPRDTSAERNARQHGLRRPRVEALEDRCLFSVSGQANLSIVLEGPQAPTILTSIHGQSLAVTQGLLFSGNFAFQANLQLMQDNPHWPISLTNVYGPALDLTEGVSFSGTLAQFTYANAPALTADSIAWGDGSSSAPTVVPGSNGQFDLQGSHTYQTTGIFSITIQVSWADGVTLTIHGSASVLIVYPENAGTSTQVSAGVPESPSSSGIVLVAGDFSIQYQPSYEPQTPEAHGGQGLPYASPPPSPFPAPNGKSDGPESNDRGSPAVSFRAVLFSVSANTPIQPSVSITITAQASMQNVATVSRVDALSQYLAAPQIGADSVYGPDSAAGQWESSGKPDAPTLNVSQASSSLPAGINQASAALPPPPPAVGGRWGSAQEVTAIFERGDADDWMVFQDHLLNGLPEEESYNLMAAVTASTISTSPVSDGTVKALGLKQSEKSAMESTWRGLGEDILMLVVLACVMVQDR